MTYNEMNLTCAMIGGFLVGAFGMTNNKPFKDWYDYLMIVFGAFCLLLSIIGF